MTVVGIDVGGTKIAGAVVEGASLSGRVERPTDLSGSDALIAAIEEAVREVAGGGTPDAVGLGVPSQIEYATGTIVSSVNIPLRGVALRSDLGKGLGVPVFVDNDANCAALGEAQLVDDAPAQHLVMLTLGTGVGGGIVTGGRIERGHDGLGAELGHAILDGRTALDASGTDFPRPGSLEWLCSGTGLERMATAAAAEAPDSALGRAAADDGRVKGREAVTAAQEGDETALMLFERLGRWLGVGIAGVINAFQPERVVIGGGLSNAADLFFDTARHEAERNTLPALWARTSIGVARGGADAGIIGAGVLAAQELEDGAGSVGPGENEHDHEGAT